MVDNMNPTPVPAAEPVASEPKKGFFSTTLGKAIVIAAGLAVVLGLLAAVGLFLLGNGLFMAAKNQIANGPVAGAPSSASATATAEEVAEPRPAEPVSDVFTFRNPFVPTVKPAVAASETASSTDASSTTSSTDGGSGDSSVPDNTLALKSISREDGALVGTFIWNGQTYSAGEGDTLEGTPWKVVNLTSTTATMLYGDSEVTLSVGQGISK